MCDCMGEYLRCIETVAESHVRSDTAQGALALAGGHVEQMRLLATELDAYWPPNAAGHRPPEGVPEPLPTLAARFRSLAERAATVEEAIRERCTSAMAIASEALRGLRVQRRAEAPYHRAPRGTGGLMDLER